MMVLRQPVRIINSEWRQVLSTRFKVVHGPFVEIPPGFAAICGKSGDLLESVQTCCLNGVDMTQQFWGGFGEGFGEFHR